MRQKKHTNDQADRRGEQRGWRRMNQPINDTPVDKTSNNHEWFYVEPPLHNHLLEEAIEFRPAKQEEGADMGP